jgi:hypothetical protein
MRELIARMGAAAHDPERTPKMPWLVLNLHPGRTLNSTASLYLNDYVHRGCEAHRKAGYAR